MNKKMIYNSVYKCDLVDCSVDEMIKKLIELKSEYDYDLQISYESYDTYSGPDYIDIYYHREETDIEYQTRIDYENELQKQKEIKEMNRLLQFKKLNPSNQLKLEHYLSVYKK